VNRVVQNAAATTFLLSPSFAETKTSLSWHHAADLRSRLPNGVIPPYSRPLMDILIGILTVVEVIVCLLLILIVLMQRPRQEGLGASFGDSAMTQLVGAQTTNVLQRGTVYLAVILFVLTLTLAVLTTRKQVGSAGTKVFEEPPPAPAPAAPAAAPAVQVTPTDAKKADDSKAPVPAAPAKADDTAKKDAPKAAEAPKAVGNKAAAPAPAAAPTPATPTPAATTPAPAASPAPAPAAATPAAPKNP
jgi:preprotein translocase subunit SecG